MSYPATWVSGGRDHPQVEKRSGVLPYDVVGTAAKVTMEKPIDFEVERAYLTEDYVPRSRHYRNVRGRLGKIYGGFNWTFRMDFPVASRACRAILAGFATHADGEGGIFKVWPHADIDRWFMCQLVDHETEGYLKDRYIGYGGLFLLFESMFPVRSVYAEEDHFYFTAAGGAYDPSEVCHFGAVAGAYTSADQIADFDRVGAIYHPLAPIVQVAQD